MEFIQSRFLKEGELNDGTGLNEVLGGYSSLTKEQEMMFIYPQFFHAIYDKIATPGILEDLRVKKQYSSLISNIGYLKFLNPSVELILSHVIKTVKKDHRASCFWAEAVINLNLHK